METDQMAEKKERALQHRALLFIQYIKPQRNNKRNNIQNTFETTKRNATTNNILNDQQHEATQNNAAICKAQLAQNTI